MIYLDYNATTPVLGSVVDAISDTLSSHWSNPSSSHSFGTDAKTQLESSRDTIAQHLNCHSDEIIFTSCGSESNNLAIQGWVFHNLSKNQKCHIISSAFEHPSVTDTISFCSMFNVSHSTLSISPSGFILTDDLSSMLDSLPDDCHNVLITIMLANNEVGTVQKESIRKVRDVIKSLSSSLNVVIHTDASQAVGKIPVDFSDLQVDMMTLTGHKFYAPKGTGCLVIKRGIVVEKVCRGGSQEGNKRAGTESVHNAVALALALATLSNKMEKTMAQQEKLRWVMYKKLKEKLNGRVEVGVNGVLGEFYQKQSYLNLFNFVLPNTLSLCLPNVNAFSLVCSLSNSVALSTGAACHSGQVSISRTLQSMGLTTSQALGTVRISLGLETSFEEIERAVELISEAVFKVSGSNDVEEEGDDTQN
ncbi:hypothetical protein GEMRC1_013006 [Eukaryota sp. GEM-RC1]